MLHPQFKTWKRCTVCGQYLFTDAQHCTDHEQPAPLLLISDRQFARVATVLEAVRDRLAVSDRQDFGRFVLGIEETNNRLCPSEIALSLFRQQQVRQAAKVVEQ